MSESSAYVTDRMNPFGYDEDGVPVVRQRSGTRDTWLDSTGRRVRGAGNVTPAPTLPAGYVAVSREDLHTDLHPTGDNGAEIVAARKRLRAALGAGATTCRGGPTNPEKK